MRLDFDNCTTEAALAGHPDKICDQIADAILDAFLRTDALANVAVECLGTGNTLIIAGEVCSTAQVDVESVAQVLYRQIGYRETLAVVDRLQPQSPQLRRPLETGAASDQTVVYGFACNTGFNHLPYGVFVANSIAKAVDGLRKQTGLYLPDGKVLVSLKDGRVDTLVLSVQHPQDVDVCALRETVLSQAVDGIVPVREIRKILFNHNSDFISGGFQNDTGVTGRKLAADTYCGLIPHGGGAFSGKDPSKIDRSAAYMARFIAKSIVGNGLAESCLVTLAYAFGLAVPVMFRVQTGDPRIDEILLSLAADHFDLSPAAIVERFALRRPIYQSTATYGHFSDPAYPWETIVSL